MENASKALLISAEVLIAMLVASMFALLFSTMSDYSKQYETSRQTQEIQAFNTQFTNYIKEGGSTAQDVISVKHLAQEWNIKNGYQATDSEYYISIYLKDGTTNGTINNWDDENEESFLNENSIDSSNQVVRYKGTMELSSQTGRVNKITFTLPP